MSVCSREHYKQQENNKVVMKIPNVLGKSSSMVTYTKTDGNIFATTKRQQFRRLLLFFLPKRDGIFVHVINDFQVELFVKESV